MLCCVSCVLCFVRCLEYALCLYCVLSVRCVVVFSYEACLFFVHAVFPVLPLVYFVCCLNTENTVQYI